MKQSQQNSPIGEKSFRDIYDSLGDKTIRAPKKEFINEIATLLMVSTKTIRGYIAGAYQPDALRKAMLAKHLGVPEDVLFPPKE